MESHIHNKSSVNSNNSLNISTICGHCSSPCSLMCSNCKKVAYCSKEHQKLHRKIHKGECNPIIIKSDPVLGQHLVTTRNIEPGEILFKEEPLITGPRSNLTNFQRICLGCCGQIINENFRKCFICKWPMCSGQCEQSSIHKDFECSIISSNNIPEPKSQDEYLCITILRCLLLKKNNLLKWEQLLNFESHVELRKRRQTSSDIKSQFIYELLKNKYKLTDINFELVDFIYGIFLVNGYGDENTCSMKLYTKASKISNCCIPNTRTLSNNNRNNKYELKIMATIPIKCGEPLNQLYGKLFKGTACRQELYQNIYYFTCSCLRCIDPTELNTHFSSIRCIKCRNNNSNSNNVGYLLPKNPLTLDINSAWNCNSCSNVQSYNSCVVPILKQIFIETGGQDLNDTLYSEYEIYGGNDGTILLTNTKEVIITKLKHVKQMLKVLQKFETKIVHKNHYSLLPLKTALISTIHTLLRFADGDKNNDNDLCYVEIRNLLPEFQRMVNELLEVVNVIFPGLTSERGILLFYYSECLKFSEKASKTEINDELKMKIQELQEESKKIMLLQPEEDSQRQLVLKFIDN